MEPGVERVHRVVGTTSTVSFKQCCSEAKAPANALNMPLIFNTPNMND